jgi:hypothetical protein
MAMVYLNFCTFFNAIYPDMYLGIYHVVYTMVYIIGVMIYTIKKWYIPWGNLPDVTCSLQLH